MYRLVSKLIIYRKVGQESILFQLADICRALKKGKKSPDVLAGRVLTQINRLLDLATRYGFNGNLWHNYLAFLLAMTETPFTLVCEKHGASEGSVQAFAKNDMDVFRKLLRSYKRGSFVNENDSSMQSVQSELPVNVRQHCTSHVRFYRYSR